MKTTKYSIKTQPTVEPVSLAEMKNFLRQGSGSFSDNLTTTQSIAPASRTAGTVTGTAVDIAGYSVVVNVTVGAVAAGGTLDVLVEHSDDSITYSTFATVTQITDTGGGATYETAYTSNKRYVRAKATVATAAVVYGIDVVKVSALAADDTLLTQLIKAARVAVEKACRRAIITQTWYAYFDSFPDSDDEWIELPLPPLASVTSITYYDTDDVSYSIDAADYYTDTVSNRGRIILKDDASWPDTFELRRYNPIVVEYVCGYGTSGASAPPGLLTALMQITAHWYQNREMVNIGNIVNEVPKMYDHLLDPYRITRL